MENKIKISYPGSEKVYLQGERFPDIRVGMRRVQLTPTVKINSQGEQELTENVGSCFLYK